MIDIELTTIDIRNGIMYAKFLREKTGKDYDNTAYVICESEIFLIRIFLLSLLLYPFNNRKGSRLVR